MSHNRDITLPAAQPIAPSSTVSNFVDTEQQSAEAMQHETLRYQVPVSSSAAVVSEPSNLLLAGFFSQLNINCTLEQNKSPKHRNSRTKERTPASESTRHRSASRTPPHAPATPRRGTGK